MISGSRTATNSDYATLKTELDKLTISEILHGGAVGFDALSERYATENRIPTKVIRPDYGKHGGKLAPLMRNLELVQLSDFVICFYSCVAPERTNGTCHTAKTAAKARKLLKEVWTRENSVFSGSLF